MHVGWVTCEELCVTLRQHLRLKTLQGSDSDASIVGGGAELKIKKRYVINTARLEDHDVIFLLSGRTDAFTETGREGLLCVLRVQAQQAAAVLTYSGTAAQSLDDSSEDENMASSSQEKQYRCASAPRSLLQPPLLMLTSCLHHTKQQTWIDRPFSRAAPSL
ncbi:unnamed protein product [Pleuronectes platessa]|uniref:Uncharacterized protein n=1 Tax=Pleuronectes platessa TaxID=8262 RepID=A0A9N7UKI8_PLEPL|nr:unnamed protein product [Pleuronectes platessa]